jgi:hypothetical protein
MDEQFEEGAAGVWLSIGDLMSGLMFFFALLFIAVLAQLQDQQERIIDRRTAIVSALVEALEQNHIEVESSAEGEITFKEEMLFERSSAELSPAGEDLIARFAPVYAAVIFSNPDFDSEIQRIVLEGHTSSEGDELYNLNLSLRRAQSVVAGMFGDTVGYVDPGHAGQLKRKLYPAGRGPWDASAEVQESDRKVILRLQFRGDAHEAWLLPGDA